jgi:flagella basal body P-ring formation protein FlgA
VITPAVLQPAVVVQRGQTVRLVIEQPGISIAAAGTALADAARGDRLRVRNTSSGKVVEGTVGADGIVRVR